MLLALAPPLWAAPAGAPEGKVVVYQVMTRLFGNTVTRNRPWGTVEENGVGTFNDIDDRALAALRDLGVTHVWYTGVPHHAVIRDYTAWGIAPDDPDVVKGRGGSPYAVRDYYNVNPDLAEDPARRLEEFRALVARTHRQGLKVITDIVPNHVARRYASIDPPPGVRDLGADDDRSVAWARDNDFYYLPGEAFRVPEWPEDYAPLGGEPHPLADGQFEENPARWTGNGARRAQPAFDDWFETVKVNFGVRPDGSHAFPELPEGLRGAPPEAHRAFWAGRDVPGSWEKFRDITRFWLDLGVDGFRYDMAGMVPVAFWSYLNSTILEARPDAFLLAEIYRPPLYRDYLQLGLMGVLYDKVGLYDTTRAIIEGRADTDALPGVITPLDDIGAGLLHFLENHDEQRIASPAFAGDPWKALPGMVLAATLRRGPVMVYFGQEVGEAGDDDAGFGDPTRTTIFDYWGVPAHQRWMNGGRFDGGALTADERALRSRYRQMLTLARDTPALAGEQRLLHAYNRERNQGYDERVFALARWNGPDRLLVVVNFGAREKSLRLYLPPDLVDAWGLAAGDHRLADRLFGADDAQLTVGAGAAHVDLFLAPYGALGLVPTGQLLGAQGAPE